MARFWIGTSGYGTKEWRGSFYPPDLPDEALPRFYAERLRTVELNQTFHRLPTSRAVQGWAREVRMPFVFSLKAPRWITHELQLRDAAEAVTGFCDLVRVLRETLGVLLFQVPPFVRKDVSRLEDFLHQFPPGYRAAFEFRNRAWLADDTLDCLRRFGVALCVTEHAQESTPVEVTAPFGYLRLRRPDYGPEDLEAWARRVLTLADEGWADVFVYFKQPGSACAPHFAMRLAALIGERVPAAAGPA